MNVRTIKHVYVRELRDQLRDRRTLFTVLILPLLIYPLLGVAMLQVAQFSSAELCRIRMIGTEYLPAKSPLIERGQFRQGLLDEPNLSMTCVDVVKSDQRPSATQSSDAWTREALTILRRQLSLGLTDAAIIIPPPAESSVGADSIPQILIVHDSSRSTSLEAAHRAQAALQQWTQGLIAENLGELQLGISDLKPYAVGTMDLADQASVSALKWSKTLPLILIIWALTGAFYPAIDLCAGEKERGTLETLLSSAARRTDIIGGKLLTVMTFSVTTAILNLLSLGISACLVVGTSAGATAVGQKLGITLPPLQIFPVLIAALIPISALFSALAFALAAFARSSKEGQYYLMPLLMLTFPLLVLPMLPGTQLSLGTSLIPVSGIILLLHALIEGNYDLAFTYFGPVSAVTLVCCGLALRWSTWQFNDESMLFRAADRVGPRAMLSHWLRRRENGPSVASAICCGLLILIARLFSTMMASPPVSWNEFWRQTFFVLCLAVAIPAVLFAVATSRKPWQSLGLRIPPAWTLVTAGLMAIFLHPAFAFLTDGVAALFPIHSSSAQAATALQQIIASAPSSWVVVLVLAIAPAIAEELAFRGYILNGFRSTLKAAHAVLATSLLFGLAHGVLQQSIITFFVGVALGFWSLRTGSILPCIVFHSFHNSLSLFLAQIDSRVVVSSSWLQSIFAVQDGSIVGYRPITALLCGLVALLLLSIVARNSLVHSSVGWTRPSGRQSTSVQA